MTNILWYRSFPPPKWLTNTYGWQCTKDTKCQKQSLVARAGIVFPRLESGVIEAEVGERKRGIVLTGWETAHALRVESRMRLEFLACSIDSAAIEKHHRRGRYFSLSFFNDLDKRNEKTRFKFNVYSREIYARFVLEIGELIVDLR